MILGLKKRTLAAAIFSIATTVVTAVPSVEADAADTTVNIAGTKAPSAAGTPVGNPVWAVPLSQLSMTRDRPIFSPSRRPPPPPASPAIARLVGPAKPAEPERPPLILVGTVAAGDSGIAVFVEQATETIVRLRVNESHQGWTLHSIQGREVTLLKDRESSVLALAPPGGSAEPASTQASLEPTVKRPKR